MNNKWNIRTELILGSEKLSILKSKKVLIVGVGGVGAFVAEYLCRAGVENLTIVDNDTIDISNINRQLPALHSNIGRSKVLTMAQRLNEINPEAKIVGIEEYVRDKKTEEILLSNKFDCVVDSIDTLSPKVHLILSCLKHKIPLVSSMGAGGKLDPSQVQCSDISKTYNCGLARAVRKKLKKHGIHKGFRAVFSPEDIKGTVISLDENSELINKKSIVGTISYMPSSFACHCTSEVLKILIK